MHQASPPIGTPCAHLKVGGRGRFPDFRSIGNQHIDDDPSTV